MFSKTPRLVRPLAPLAVFAACNANGSGTLADAVGIAGPSAHQRENMPMVTLPIEGTWDNTEAPPSAEPPDGCLVHLVTAQTGHANHVGAFRGEGQTCVTAQNAPVELPPFWDHAPAPPYAVMDFTNEMVWTAANGDELWLRPNGGVFVMSLANGAATVHGQLTIAGGTGRFDGATGSLQVTGGRDAGEPGDHLNYRGEITLRPGSRAAR